jgi:catechol 2,3-dioxygenase-like lactoylglutathione lyase family enzyme
MIFGAHLIVYSKDAAADRAFFRDVLGFSSVDAGHDWLIFALPPAELAVHPAEESVGHELFLMCDDLNAEMADLEAKHVRCSKVEQARWGSLTRIRLPGGGELGLYEPTHPSPLAPAPND